MPRLLPQFLVEHVRGDDLRVATIPVLRPDEGHELVVDPGPMGEPEGGARRQFVEHEELLLDTDGAVVPLLGVLEVLLVRLQLLLVRKTHPVHALERIVVIEAEPGGARGAERGEGLDLAGVHDMGAPAEVNEVTAAVYGRAGPVRHLRSDELDLERVVMEQLESLLFRHLEPLEDLFLLDDAAHLRVNRLKVGLGERCVAHEGVVVKPCRGRRADGEVRPEDMLKGLPEHMRRRVPEHGLRVLVVKFEKLNGAVPLQWSFEIPHLPPDNLLHLHVTHDIRISNLRVWIDHPLPCVAHLGSDAAICKPLAYFHRNVEG
mmetsp:Transcript_20163/g.27410  ORF Transcript_20163/g.27410 Transcript_20163/m.27410 type:complete len:318 (-) Transcript_20163:403-1356(-)